MHYYYQPFLLFLPLESIPKVLGVRVQQGEEHQPYPYFAKYHILKLNNFCCLISNSLGIRRNKLWKKKRDFTAIILKAILVLTWNEIQLDSQYGTLSNTIRIHRMHIEEYQILFTGCINGEACSTNVVIFWIFMNHLLICYNKKTGTIEKLCSI